MSTNVLMDDSANTYIMEYIAMQYYNMKPEVKLAFQFGSVMDKSYRRASTGNKYSVASLKMSD